MKRLIAAALVFSASGLGLAAPAMAQDSPGDRVNQLIVYGDDPCPQSTGEEITVCARKAEDERYRIPEPLRGSDSPQNEAWTQRVQAYETVGASGIMSCSPAGAGGEYGCTQKLIKEAYAERKGSSDVQFGKLIAKARADRLSTIDSEAAEQQKSVEQEEKEYDARKAAEAAAGPGDPAADAQQQQPQQQPAGSGQ